MAIVVNMDLMLVRRKMTLTELSQRVNVSVTNLSLSAICRELECGPGDLLEYVPDFAGAAERRKQADEGTEL
jgi:putative transcriptional regulator